MNSDERMKLFADLLFLRVSQTNDVFSFDDGQGRVSRSMQTIEINGPKGVDFEMSERLHGIGGRDKRGRRRLAGMKRGVECAGQSIIKPALSLLGSVNED